MRTKILIPLVAAVPFAFAQEAVVPTEQPAEIQTQTNDSTAVAIAQDSAAGLVQAESIAAAQDSATGVVQAESVASAQDSTAGLVQAESVAAAQDSATGVVQAESVAAAQDSASVLQQDSAAAEQAKPVTFTEIGGVTKGFLTAANSPYLVTETLVVNEKDALIIDAGVVLKFKKGTGLEVKGGAFAAIGEESAPVVFAPEAEGETWNGIFIASDIRADFKQVNISGATIALLLEKTGADLQDFTIENSSTGLSAHVSSVKIQSGKIRGISGAALIASAGSLIEVNNVELTENNVAVYAAERTNFSLSNTKIAKNQYGILDMGNNSVKNYQLALSENNVGVITVDMPAENLKEAATNNAVNFTTGAMDLFFTLPHVPENDFTEASASATALDEPVMSQEKRWMLTGNVGTEIGYHVVSTEKDQNGDDYTNYFQVPGLYSRYNTYMKLTSPDGRLMEFTADIGSDDWNNWNVHKVNLSYTDSTRKISLGDIYMNAGETYLNGVDFFGASYSTGLHTAPGEKPLLEATLFAGEARSPKLVGDRNNDIYKDWNEDGEAETQEMIAGGKITWNMHRRFNGSIGFIGSSDYKEDPFLRDGMSENRNTVDPEITSKTFFAEGNWLFWPGDIELNGQFALGAADTADVQTQRAVNDVFSQAGVSVSNFALLRKLMKNSSLIRSLSRSELEEIFGDNSTMTLKEMRDELEGLIADAKRAENRYKSKEDEQSNLSEWDGQNIAARAALRWGLGKTTLNGYYKFVGSKFYSAGSPDQLSNSREFGLSADQRFSRTWRWNLAYDMSVENASIGNKYNVFGFAEGTTAGLFGDPTSQWEKDHDQDAVRALYIHDITFKNNLKYGNLELLLKYKANYRKRNRATRLYAEYDANSGVYEDDWFKAKKGKKTYTVEAEKDTFEIDSARFMQYYGLANQAFLASGFEERLLKHTVEAEASLKLGKNLLRFGGMWIYRIDKSGFDNDSLLKKFDFSDKTYGYLGYYFHGADFFEQRYPVSFTLNTDRFRNQIAFTPRYKTYTRDSMTEFEWTLNENFEINLAKDFMDLSLNAEIRQEFISRDNDGTDEEEADLNGAATLRVFYNKDLYSDYTLGGTYSFRPDSRQDYYKDFFVSASLNYAF